MRTYNESSKEVQKYTTKTVRDVHVAYSVYVHLVHMYKVYTTLQLFAIKITEYRSPNKYLAECGN